MFDTYELGRREYVPYEKTVVEQRAPTDDSIKLLNEMQEKVMTNIMDRHLTTNNVLNVNWFSNPITPWGGLQFSCRFTINGRKFDFTVDVDRHEILGSKPADIVKRMHDKVIEKLAIMILAEGMYGDVGRSLDRARYGVK